MIRGAGAGAGTGVHMWGCVRACVHVWAYLYLYQVLGRSDACVGVHVWVRVRVCICGGACVHVCMCGLTCTSTTCLEEVMRV